MHLHRFGTRCRFGLRRTGYNILDHLLQLRHVARSQEQSCSANVQNPRGLDPQSGGAARDENRFVMQFPHRVAVFQDLHRRGSTVARPIGLRV